MSGPNLDSVDNVARRAAAAIRTDASWLYRAGKTEGFRAGLESASRLVEVVTASARTDFATDSGVRDTIIATCEQICIQLRLTALQIADPPEPTR
nr:hypothetical protein [Mycobacterium sp. UM_NZ2]